VSCVHGVERWRAIVLYTAVTEIGQQWREPLRNALDWLRDEVSLRTRAAPRVPQDPWAARDAYIDVILDRSDENVERSSHSMPP